MKFIIEQIAICPAKPAEAKKLLEDMGCGGWVEDVVVAEGEVFGIPGENKANLSFNYDMIAGKEFEVLDYTEGKNWMMFDDRPNTVSHLGMHCSASELSEWRTFFAERGYLVAQEVNTISHTNEVIKGKRTYNYVIFNTRAVLGVDIKFIVRKDVV